METAYKVEKWLRHEVEIKGKSFSQVSKEQGVSSGSIQYYAQKYGIRSAHQQVSSDFADRGRKPKKYVSPFSKKLATNKRKQQVPEIEVGDYVEVVISGYYRTTLHFAVRGEVVYSNRHYFQVLSKGIRESVLHIDVITGQVKLKKHVKKADLEDWERGKKLLGGGENVHRGENAGAEGSCI